jgi:hypothetical protein
MRALAWGFLFALLAPLGACAGAGKSGPGGACEKPRDCIYGLECRAKSCQFIAYGDCEGDGVNPLSGAPQCLSGQRCRDNRCTVQCAAPGDCAAGESCRIGLCQRTGNGLRQCVDNRDCAWPEACFNGQCATRADATHCSTDVDCGLGDRCVGNRCM